MSNTGNYFRELGDWVADRWNRFWFTPKSTELLGAARIAFGACALMFVLGYSFDLTAWFGKDGVFPMETLREISIGGGSIPYRLSWFYLSDSPGVLWALHALGILIITAMTVGWQPRITVPLSLFVVLSYIHRAPVLSGPFEPVLCMGLLYLSVGYVPSLVMQLVTRFRGQGPRPVAEALTLDAKLAAGKDDVSQQVDESQKNDEGQLDESERTLPIQQVFANIAIRLAQIHLVGFYLVMLSTQLSGETWWIGEAVWSLMASSETRLFDFQAWGQSSVLINLWTYEILLFEAGFAVLIWNRMLRPLVMAFSVVHWMGIIVLTAMPDYGLVMIAANAVFLTSVPRRQRKQPRTDSSDDTQEDTSSNVSSSVRQRKRKRPTTTSAGNA